MQSFKQKFVYFNENSSSEISFSRFLKDKAENVVNYVNIGNLYRV